MKELPIKLGPLSLLLTVIVLCMTTLSILTFTTARADMRLAEIYADTVRTRYELETRGQDFLAAAERGGLAEAAPLADAVERDGALCRASFADADGFRLEIVLEQKTGGWTVREWTHTRAWEENTEIGNLWQGNETTGENGQ